MAAKTYPETSLERAAYLAANGIIPSSGEWNYDDLNPIYIFRYKHTDKLGRLLMEYKASKSNVLLGMFISIFNARGKKLKQLKGQNFSDEETDLAKIISNYRNPYSHD